MAYASITVEWYVMKKEDQSAALLYRSLTAGTTAGKSMIPTACKVSTAT